MDEKQIRAAFEAFGLTPHHGDDVERLLALNGDPREVVDAIWCALDDSTPYSTIEHEVERIAS